MDEQARSNSWDAEKYRENYSFISSLGKPVLKLLDASPGEKILDLGCGDGSLSKELVRAGCTILGVDSSVEMIELAKNDGLDAIVCDGQSLIFSSEFDAVFSNAALHWMSEDPVAVIQGVRRSLKRGGRFVAELGGFGNCAAVVTAILSSLIHTGMSLEEARARIPWFFPTVEDYNELLETAGFKVEYIELIPRQTPLPMGMADWYETFGDPFFRGMNREQKSQVIQESVDLLQPVLYSSKRGWTADYVRLRFRASLMEP